MSCTQQEIKYRKHVIPFIASVYKAEHTLSAFLVCWLITVFSGACKVYNSNDSTVSWVTSLRGREWASPLPVSNFAGSQLWSNIDVCIVQSCRNVRFGSFEITGKVQNGPQIIIGAGILFMFFGFSWLFFFRFLFSLRIPSLHFSFLLYYFTFVFYTLFIWRTLSKFWLIIVWQLEFQFLSSWRICEISRFLPSLFEVSALFWLLDTWRWDRHVPKCR